MSQPKFEQAQAIVDFAAREREIAAFWKSRGIIEIGREAPRLGRNGLRSTG